MTSLFERTLIPLDGSDLAEEAIDAAVPLILAQHGEAVLCMVEEPRLAREFEEFADSERISVSRAMDIYLHKASEELDGRGVRVRAVHLSDPDPASGILKAADDENATAIAISSHGRTGPKRWLLGSVADKVLRAAPCPVLLLRHRETT